jgi:hypothetical protein
VMGSSRDRQQLGVSGIDSQERLHRRKDTLQVPPREPVAELPQSPISGISGLRTHDPTIVAAAKKSGPRTMSGGRRFTSLFDPRQAGSSQGCLSWGTVPTNPGADRGPRH